MSCFALLVFQWLLLAHGSPIPQKSVPISSTPVFLSKATKNAVSSLQKVAESLAATENKEPALALPTFLIETDTIITKRSNRDSPKTQSFTAPTNEPPLERTEDALPKHGSPSSFGDLKDVYVGHGGDALSMLGETSSFGGHDNAQKAKVQDGALKVDRPDLMVAAPLTGRDLDPEIQKLLNKGEPPVSYLQGDTSLVGSVEHGNMIARKFFDVRDSDDFKSGLAESIANALDFIAGRGSGLNPEVVITHLWFTQKAGSSSLEQAGSHTKGLSSNRVIEAEDQLNFQAPYRVEAQWMAKYAADASKIQRISDQLNTKAESDEFAQEIRTHFEDLEDERTGMRPNMEVLQEKPIHIVRNIISRVVEGKQIHIMHKVIAPEVALGRSLSVQPASISARKL